MDIYIFLVCVVFFALTVIGVASLIAISERLEGIKDVIKDDLRADIYRIGNLICENHTDRLELRYKNANLYQKRQKKK